MAEHEHGSLKRLATGVERTLDASRANGVSGRNRKFDDSLRAVAARFAEAGLGEDTAMRN